MQNKSSVTLSFTSNENKKVKYYIKKNIHKLNIS